MIKQNKWRLLLSSAVILLPILAGLLLWNHLPEQMVTHWGADGNPDGFMGRAAAVFLMPLLLLAIHWVCVLATAKDPKNQDQNHKVFGIIFWITPTISLVTNGMVYAIALGYTPRMEQIILILLSVTLLFIGNYLPKCKQNFTIGIKIKWTLANEENWNATHRFAGKAWVIGGLLLIPCICLPRSVFLWLLIPLFAVIVLLPLLYSYLYYQKQVKEGKAPKKANVPMTRTYKIIGWVTGISLLVLFGVILFICFTGDITPHYGETEFTLEASYFDDLTLEYSAIQKAEFRRSDDAGSRVMGFGSPRLSLGRFESDEHGAYLRYTYTKCPSVVVLELSDGRTVVLNGKTEADTLALYQQLSSKIGT